MEKKEQDFQARECRITEYYWKPNPPTFLLSGRVIRNVRHLRKNTVYGCFSKYLQNLAGVCTGKKELLVPFSLIYTIYPEALFCF